MKYCPVLKTHHFPNGLREIDFKYISQKKLRSALVVPIMGTESGTTIASCLPTIDLLDNCFVVGTIKDILM